MRAHVIRQGEYLSRLATEMGFDAHAVWQHDANRALRERRANPELLAPGDILYVPSSQLQGLPVRPGETHRFRASGPATSIRLVFRDGDEVLRNEPCVIEALGRPPTSRTTDGNGTLELTITPYAAVVRVRFDRLGVECPVLLGHLDPIEEVSGVRQRLAHLGYLATASVGESEAQDAVRAFQEAQGLRVNGEVDAATRVRLREIHGS